MSADPAALRADCEHGPKWTKQPALPGFHPCKTCPPKPDLLPLDAPLSVGFGQVTVVKGEEVVWSGDDLGIRLRLFEIAARKEPDNDWRVTFYAPLYEAEYQRHGESEWALVRRGDGFA